jgi:hypothetical protein
MFPETSALTRATGRHITEDGILQKYPRFRCVWRRKTAVRQLQLTAPCKMCLEQQILGPLIDIFRILLLKQTNSVALSPRANYTD